jgi:lipoprotein-anchoring transpeptidase ErfK/SrfK
LKINHSQRVSSKVSDRWCHRHGELPVLAANSSKPALSSPRQWCYFGNAILLKSSAHAAVACEIAPIMAFLRAKSIFLERTMMTRGFAFLVAAVTLLAGAGHARAQGFDMRDVMGGGSFFGLGSSVSSSARREVVSFVSRYKPGTIYIDTAERRLYLVLPQGQALRYGIGVGRDGFRWSGVHRISAKKEWPSWTPPSQMLSRRPDLPRHMVGGPDNPLGARAMYLGSTLYRIHGSNEPDTIGQAVSSGCFRMTNEDVTDLYNRVSVGATVVVRN